MVIRVVWFYGGGEEVDFESKITVNQQIKIEKYL